MKRREKNEITRGKKPSCSPSSSSSSQPEVISQLDLRLYPPEVVRWVVGRFGGARATLAPRGAPPPLRPYSSPARRLTAMRRLTAIM